MHNFLPRLRKTQVGLRISATKSNKKTSVEFLPRSTKSPLNKNALCADGNPFCMNQMIGFF